jgi:aryl-alcohol dehydrogenase-like predicted oxidoreductase
MLEIPRIIVGTARLGSVLPAALTSKSRSDFALRQLDALVEAGATAFDLAASYQLGGTERLIGRWVASRRHRDRLFLISKGAHPYPVVRPNRLRPSAIAADLDATLRRLRTDRVDLYLLHRDFPGAPLEPMVVTLRDAHRAGKILSWGVSNWAHTRIQAIDQVARQAGLPPISASSPHFSVFEWIRTPWTGSVTIAGAANLEARAFYQRTQLHVLAWGPLGSGFLVSDRRARRFYGSAANFTRKERLYALASQHDATPAQIALAYLYHHAFPVSAVVAASTVDKMRSNLASTTIRLSRAEMDSLEGAV